VFAIGFVNQVDSLYISRLLLGAPAAILVASPSSTEALGRHGDTLGAHMRHKPRPKSAAGSNSLLGPYILLKTRLDLWSCFIIPYLRQGQASSRQGREPAASRSPVCKSIHGRYVH
jgi:hypothetical protein